MQHTPQSQLVLAKLASIKHRLNSPSAQQAAFFLQTSDSQFVDGSVRQCQLSKSWQVLVFKHATPFLFYLLRSFTREVSRFSLPAPSRRVIQSGAGDPALLPPSPDRWPAPSVHWCLAAWSACCSNCSMCSGQVRALLEVHSRPALQSGLTDHTRVPLQWLQMGPVARGPCRNGSTHSHSLHSPLRKLCTNNACWLKVFDAHLLLSEDKASASKLGTAATSCNTTMRECCQLCEGRHDHVNECSLSTNKLFPFSRFSAAAVQFRSEIVVQPTDQRVEAGR